MLQYYDTKYDTLRGSCMYSTSTIIVYPTDTLTVDHRRSSDIEGVLEYTKTTTSLRILFRCRQIYDDLRQDYRQDKQSVSSTGYAKCIVS